MSKKIIAVDNDDVIFECVEAIFKYHNAVYKTNFLVKDQLVYGLRQTFGCDEEEETKRIFDFFESDYFSQMKPFPGALSALKKLKKDFKLVVVTARPTVIRQKTVDAIQHHFPDIFESVYLTNGFSKEGTKKTKSEVCKELGVSLLIDDSYDNAQECKKAGLEVILFQRPWNQHLTKKELTKQGIIPAKNWPEVVQVINKSMFLAI